MKIFGDYLSTFYFQYVYFVSILTVLSAKNCRKREDNFDAAKPPEHHQGPDPAVSGLGSAPGGLEKPRKRCCPYEFDSSICQVLDDRVLCGYDKNVGRAVSKDTAKELSDGCRLRNGRLECSYLDEPYVNLRRPPAWDRATSDQDKGVVHDYADGVVKLKASTNRPVRCVEVNDRVICKPVV